MNEDEFKLGMDTFDARWERVSSKGKRDVYFRSLHNLLSVGWGFIVEQAVDVFRTYPTPGEIKTLYSQFLRDNPNIFKSDIVDSDCSYCEGRGSFIYLKKCEIGYYEHISKCPHCKNRGRTKGLPELDRTQLEAMGYEVLPQTPQPRSPPGPTIKNKRKLVEKATQQSKAMFKGEC